MKLEDYIKENKEGFNDQRMPQEATGDFEALLKAKLHVPPSKVRKLHILKILSMAASILLLVSLGIVLSQKQTEITATEELVSRLENPQTNSERLEALYSMEKQLEYKEEDEQILNAFFKILREESDANSKIAVIDALLKFPNNQIVRAELIKALENEQEPLVQLKLIKSVAILREKRAVEPLQKIIDNDESLPLVKGNASALLAMLNQ